MKTRALLVVSALAAGACLPPVAQWPYRGDFVCSKNETAQTRAVVAEDGEGRLYAVRVAKPGEEKCYRWPFVHYDGRVGLAAARDTVWGAWFRPWHGIRGGEPAAETQAARGR